jgi:hypothetical protein
MELRFDMPAHELNSPKADAQYSTMMIPIRVVSRGTYLALALGSTGYLGTYGFTAVITTISATSVETGSTFGLPLV